MKEKITISICVAILLAGMFGLQAIAEAEVSFGATAFGLAGIFAVMYGTSKVINKHVN